MAMLGAAQLLDAWEDASALAPPAAALRLLAAACPQARPDELAALPLGRRNQALLHLRSALFGDDMALVAACPACAERLETRVALATLCAAPTTDGGAREVVVDARRFRVRLPGTADLDGLPLDPAAAARALLARCLQDTDVDAAAMSDREVEALAAAMADADPLADPQLRLCCPACGHGWDAGLDVAASLLQEIHAWAQRTLREVDALARSYGWREPDILALSPARRRLYLEMGQP
jgi:hypothetical protein